MFPELMFFICFEDSKKCSNKLKPIVISKLFEQDEIISKKTMVCGCLNYGIKQKSVERKLLTITVNYEIISKKNMVCGCLNYGIKQKSVERKLLTITVNYEIISKKTMVCGCLNYGIKQKSVERKLLTLLRNNSQINL